MTLLRVAVTIAALTTLPSLGHAEERAWQLSLRGGFATSTGALSSPSGTFEVGGWYGLSDAFSLYGDVGYSVGPRSRGLRHGGSFSVGAVYLFDVIRVVPFVGLGARFDAVHGDDRLVLSPSVEARGGLYYLLRRGLALDLQASYAFPFVGRELSADHFAVTFGVRFITEP